MAGDRYIISKGTPEEQKPGSWWLALRGRIFVRCPECRSTARLDHGISDQGEVHPSLDCDTKVCSFHRFVILEGWEPVKDY